MSVADPEYPLGGVGVGVGVCGVWGVYMAGFRHDEVAGQVSVVELWMPTLQPTLEYQKIKDICGGPMVVVVPGQQRLLMKCWEGDFANIEGAWPP